MLYNKKLINEGGGHGGEVIKLKIRALDREINRYIYELYGLTDEEIAIVEESVKR